MPKLPKKTLVSIIFIAIIIIVSAGTVYAWGWSQSNFKCISWIRPITNPFNSDKQIYACRTFADLNGYSVNVTKVDLEKIVAQRKKSGASITINEAEAFAFGRAKIAEAARIYNVTVSDAEIKAELGTLGVSAETRQQVTGYLLQHKLEKVIVGYRIADVVLVRWDWRKTEYWKPEITQLRDEARKNLVLVKSELEKGATLKEATKAAVFDQGKFSVYSNTNEELIYNPQSSSGFRNITILPKGVSDVICDDRLCGLFKVTGGNDGKYHSFDEFMGGLKGW